MTEQRHDLIGDATQRVAIFGGIYSNYLALDAAIADAKRRGAQRLYCLGDMGAFGPHPDRVFPLLMHHDVICIQGNYDDSIGNGLDDCQCGYTDPRDNHFAQISYDYTLANTSNSNREFLRQLPLHRRERWGEREVLLCHGSPRRVNEFLWESTTSTTHTGIKWRRELQNDRQFINVGALGRPENDGQTRVWYAWVETGPEEVAVEFIPVTYDHQRLAREMQDEQLPAEFVETVLTGYWTTCLEVLPSKERRRGVH